jgi:hypothetical protein
VPEGLRDDLRLASAYADTHVRFASPRWIGGSLATTRPGSVTSVAARKSSVVGRPREEVTMDESEWLAVRFEEHRSHLRTVAYRIDTIAEPDRVAELAVPAFGR